MASDFGPLDCIGLVGPKRSIWIFCRAPSNESYSYVCDLAGTYHWTDTGNTVILQSGQTLTTIGWRRLTYDEASQLYALARLVESNSSYADRWRDES
jgi:hypothetical protein